jgi:hypothetical protein
MQVVIQHLYLLPMLISAILSLKTFRLNWPAAYKTFSVSLFVALFTELFARFWRFYLHNHWGFNYPHINHWIYTTSLIPQSLLLLAVFYQIIHTKLYKKIILLFAVLVVIFVVLNFSLWQSFYEINSNSHVFIAALVLVVVLMYFEELRREKEVKKLSQQPMVWIAFGVSVFHLLSIPYFLSINYLIDKHPSLAGSFIYMYLLFICFWYLLYIKALLCPTPQDKISA